MKTVLITGSRGFIGKNLLVALGRKNEVNIKTYDSDDESALLDSHLKEADFIFHLAGVNRPKNQMDFEIVNSHLTRHIIETLGRLGRTVPILFTSSVQAKFDSPYGKSKKAAEDILHEYNKRTKAQVYIYRLPGVFGKWSRPNYNTVVATFCHNIARDLPVAISDPQKEIELVYIDDVVNHFLQHISNDSHLGNLYYEVDRTFKVRLGQLFDKIHELRDITKTQKVPDLADPFMKCLHATYLSFLDAHYLSYPLDLKTDNRGSLFELIKSDHFGQVFISKTRKGIMRGNHYHDSKVEKFCVIQGRAAIRFRHVLNQEVIDYHVSGEKIEIVDIPPGYTHHIENLGDGEMIVLFWANQIFNPDNTDTYFLPVDGE
jgi:UDP-2-acetamido-2,6-beta-L-arabino-hexul-4-ose reductase